MFSRFNKQRMYFFWAVSLCAILLGPIGCRGRDGATTENEDTQRLVDNLFSHTSDELTQERWDAHYVRDAKVGHRHTQIFNVTIGAQVFTKVVAVDSLEMKRFGDVVEQRLKTASLESPDGTVLQFAYELDGGDAAERGDGEVVGRHLIFTHQRGDAEDVRTFDWSNVNGGLFAIERSMARKPMQPGETRTIEAFLPLLDRVVRYRLTAFDYGTTPVGEQQLELLRIESSDAHADGWNIPTVYWADRGGVVQKTQEAFLDRTTVRSDEEVATAANDLARLDLGIDVGVPLAEEFEDAHETLFALYRVKLDGHDAEKIFATGPSQQVQVEDDGTALIAVNQVRPDFPQQLAGEVRPPTREDMAPNWLIESDNPRVSAIANAVAGTIDDPWRAAKALETYLYRRINKEDFSRVFSSAAEVAATGKGDCSEHAVLLAATCRARGIPARVAVGLLYSPEDERFLYHMWTEVWIRDRWVPLDATLGNGGIGAGHLKLHDSSLAGESAYSMVAPVIFLIGKLEIELVDSGR